MRFSFSRPVWRVVACLAILVCLQSLWSAAAGTAVERLVIDQATVKPAVLLINTLTPGLNAHARGWSIDAPGGGTLNIVNGCDGTEIWFLLLAAFAIAPLSSWRARVLGAGLGTLVVYALNQARILVLFYSSRSDSTLFGVLHTTVGPIVLIVAVALYFHAWLLQDANTAAKIH